MFKGKQGKKKKRKGRNILTETTLAMIVMVVICCLFTWYEIYNLEEGLMDVCANQQDAYVQLVLDQINLKDNRDDEDIIEDILGTLDSSSNKYWTFSKDKDMLFIKDVIETNRYKGLTTASYYDSSSAKSFLEGLQENRVIHRTIAIDGKGYVASGVSFQYGDEEYRLCLLTSKDVILNNNKFMGAKFELVILVGFILIVLMCISMIFARNLEQLRRQNFEKGETIQSLQGTVGQLNEMISQKEHYDTRYQVWSKDMLGEFLVKLQKKSIKKVVMVRLCCMDESDRYFFLEEASVLLDKRTLRFAVGENDFLLLFLQCDKNSIQNSLKPLLSQGTVQKEIVELNLNKEDMEDFIRKINEEG